MNSDNPLLGLTYEEFIRSFIHSWSLCHGHGHISGRCGGRGQASWHRHGHVTNRHGRCYGYCSGHGHTHANVHSINACRSYSFSLVLTVENAVCILERNVLTAKFGQGYSLGYLFLSFSFLSLSVLLIFRGCHLGVFPSYYEPWGYTPAEW